MVVHRLVRHKKTSVLLRLFDSNEKDIRYVLGKDQNGKVLIMLWCRKTMKNNSVCNVSHTAA